MKIKEILDKIQKIAPIELAMEWDNIGLIIGDENSIIQKALVCLDIDEISVGIAIKKKANLIISHHPPIFTPIKKINSPLLIQIIQNGINVICVHTNLDAALEGVNFVLAKNICLSNLRKIDDLNSIGLLGDIQKTEIRKFAKFVKKKLQAPFVKLYPKTEILQTVAVCGGNGAFLLDTLVDKADILISSDFKYHQIITSEISILDVGHFYSERPALEIFCDLLRSCKIEFVVSKTSKIENLEVI